MRASHLPIFSFQISQNPKAATRRRCHPWRPFRADFRDQPPRLPAQTTVSRSRSRHPSPCSQPRPPDCARPRTIAPRPSFVPWFSRKPCYVPPIPERSTLDPDICNGRPVVRGTRITVQTVFEFLGAGDSIEDLLAEYPALTREDVQACLGSP